jgi:outer membrane receptor protein involved in Fe transport
MADVSAQTTTGKITGRVTDARTKEALPGVSVAVVGTRLGAVTDAKGDYVILGVAPGTYTLKVTIVGYATQEIPAQVTVDRTTTADVSMAVEAIQMGAVEVVGQRPLVEQEVSFTQQIMSRDQVRGIPTGSARLQHAIMTQVGVDRDNWGVVVRGNDDRDVAFVQDGVRFNQRLFQRPFSSYPTSSIQEIQVLTGGFAPEYGQARAGVVNIVSKEPSQWLVSGEARYITAGNHWFGGQNVFRDNYWNVKRWMNMDPAGDVNQDGRPDFEGWKRWLARTSAIKQNIYLGQTVTSAEQARGIWLYQHRRVKKDGTVMLADGTTLSQKDPAGVLQIIGDEGDYSYAYDATVGGPLIKDRVSALYSFRRERTPSTSIVWNGPGGNTGLPNFTQSVHQGKLMFTPTTGTKLTLMGLFGLSEGSGNSRPHQNIGGAIGNVNEVGGGPPLQTWNQKLQTNIQTLRQWQVGAGWRHVLSPRTFYEAMITRQRSKLDIGEGRTVDDRGVVAVYPDGRIDIYSGMATGTPKPRFTPARGAQGATPIWEETPEQLAWANAAKASGAVVIGNDPNGWGSARLNRDLLGVGDVGGGSTSFNNFRSNQGDFSASLTTQLKPQHQVKVGTTVQVADIFESSGYIEGQTYFFIDNRRHWSGSFYAQDKMEYNNLVVNAGARLEWDRYDKHYDFHHWSPTDPASDWFWKDPRRGAWDPENYTIDQQQKTVRPPMKWYLAPRLGMSYPITETAKLYFNYGYFYRAPSMREMYMLYQGEIDGRKPSFIGNPYASALRTVQYEVGYEQGFFAGRPHAFKLGGNIYFKDSNRDQFTGFLVFAYPGAFPGFQPYQTYIMQDIRGVEVTLQKARGRFWTGYVGYDFNLSRIDNAQYSTVSFDPNEPTANKTYTVNQAQKAAESQARPILRANLNVYSPAEWSKDPVKGGWELDLYYFRKRGQGFNYNPTNDPLLRGILNKRWIAERYVNLRVSKEINLRGARPQFYLDVNNLFDWPYPVLVGNIFAYPTGMNFPVGAASTTAKDFDAYMAEVDRRGLTPGEWIGEPGSAEFNKFMPIYWWRNYQNKRRVYFGVRFDM